MAEINLQIAKEMAGAFAQSCGVCCRLISATGDILCEYGQPFSNECDFLRALPGLAPSCRAIHLNGIQQAERFGGRYIYSCASGLTFFSSPIISEGAMVGGLVAGPLLLTDVDDCLDELIQSRDIPAGQVRDVRNFLTSLPTFTPAQLRHLSAQLFASSVCISDSSRELFRAQTDADQQRSIGEYVQQVKAEHQEVPYPMDTEKNLVSAISQGNKPAAAALLNEILGHIFFFTPNPDFIQTRITELLVLLSRAAIDGGASADLIFEINHQYMQELKRLNTQEEVAQWLARALNRFTDLVFNLVDSKHKNIIHRAVSYMTAHCARDLTMAEVADHVGYSHSHFSKVFKEETNSSFRLYLNQLRVEKSKALLLSTNLSIAEICDQCGFEDQSYHCKVFKKLVGVTPDKYRKHGRRIDREKEYGNG